VGQLVYEQKSTFDIEDRSLAHLRIVVMNKLRRQESFMLQVPHREVGHVSLWMAPGIPVAFQFSGSRSPRIDRDLVDEWMQQASGSDGLSLTSRAQ